MSALLKLLGPMTSPPRGDASTSASLIWEAARGLRLVGVALALLALVLLLTACGTETYPPPGYKTRPPISAGSNQAIKTAPLSGRVYTAESPTLDSATQLPMGYALLPGEEGRVTVRIPGTPTQTRVVPIKDGAYEVPDLPMGVMIEVSASCPGYASRRQQVEIRLPAGRRLNFEHDPDGTGSYLLPLKDPPVVMG